MAVIDDNLAKAITELFRLSQLDLMNQDAFFNSVNDTVVITKADGSQLVIKSASGLMNATGTVGGKTGGAITGDVSIEGGNMNLRASTPGGGWPFLINFQAGQGNNLTYARLYQERSGDVTIATAVASGTPKYFLFNSQGGMVTQGNISCVSLTQTSDADKYRRCPFNRNHTFSTAAPYPAAKWNYCTSRRK